jgi:Ribosomal protein S3
MGQKIHPGGLRVGVIHDWKSNWYTGTKDFPAYLLEDIKIREHIYGKLEHAGLSDILIRKDASGSRSTSTPRPAGIVIGKSGSRWTRSARRSTAMTNKAVHININEIKRPSSTRSSSRSRSPSSSRTASASGAR